MEFRNIKDGWLNYVKFLTNNLAWEPGVRGMAEERAKICVECPELKTTDRKVESLKGPSTKEAEELPIGQCLKCGCLFPMLVFAPGKKCPLKKW
jgi:hypothetical protein